MKPPVKIDGARVVEWAWSGSAPFGEVPGADPPENFGLVIATYDNIQFYRFSCDRNWKTTQDAVYDSVGDANEHLPVQYRAVKANWQSY